jgi:hypothetical protein
VIIDFNEKQLKVLDKLELTYDPKQELSDDNCIDLEEKVGDYYTLHCLDANDSPNEEGRTCESILDILAEL